MRWWSGPLVACVLLGGCRQQHTPEPSRFAEVAGLAQVGALYISAKELEAVAERQNVAPTDAWLALEQDALLAQWLVRRHPSRAARLGRMGLVHALLRDLRDQAEQRGPVSADERRRLLHDRWWLWDRPRLVRVTHAVFLAASRSGEGALRADGARARARALAADVRQRLGARASEQRLRAVCSALALPESELKVEALLPVAADGRAIDPSRPPPLGPSPTRYETEFAEAAAALREPGEVSPVVASPYGFHVLVATEVFSPRRVGQADAELARQVYSARAKQALQAVLERQRTAAKPQREPRAVALTEGLVR